MMATHMVEPLLAPEVIAGNCHCGDGGNGTRAVYIGANGPLSSDGTANFPFSGRITPNCFVRAVDGVLRE